MNPKKINGRKVTKKRRVYLCCVCYEDAWGGPEGVDLDSLTEKWDIEVRPGEWVITCGQDPCVFMLKTNPLAYENYVQPVQRTPKPQ